MTKKWVISSDLESARRVEEELLHLVEGNGYGPAAAFAIKLALEEGLNNAVRHGNGGDARKSVEVVSCCDAARFEITITDQGHGFDPSAVPDPTADENLEKPSGRGIMLMRSYLDEVSYNNPGNEVQLIKKRC